MKEGKKKLVRGKTLLLTWSLFVSSCYQDHLYVQHEWIDRNFLASSHIRTPDPRQEDPPEGQRLLVRWKFPRSIFEKQLHLQLTIRFWDNTQETLLKPIQRKQDYAVFFFPSFIGEKERRILTYQVQVLTQVGGIVGVWEHPLWTKLIEIGPKNDRPSSSFHERNGVPQRTNS